MAKSGKKRGRPPIPATRRRRNNLTIRIRDGLKETLARGGRSQQALDKRGS